MAEPGTHHGRGMLIATATALPPHTLTRDDVKRYVREVFSIDERRADALITVIDNAKISSRRATVPIDCIIQRRSLAQKAGEYHEHAVTLGREAAENCLRRAAMTASDIDLIITVSCTGFMIPSLDAHLINLIGFRSDVRRLPITELGCAAGGMALSFAAD